MYAAEDLFTEEPDLEVIQENGDENMEQDNDEDEEGTRVVIKPKRVIRNPQPKLDARLLTGPKGLTALEGYFKKVNYKGKGHEEQDLKTIMKVYEHWCHRLFPKFPFDDCLARIEKLGYKKPVQTHIKKIRMNMLEPDEAEVASTDVASVDSVPADPEEDAVHFTEEQLLRMQRNRERAELLRKQRQEAQEKAFNELQSKDQGQSDTAAAQDGESDSLSKDTSQEDDSSYDRLLSREASSKFLLMSSTAFSDRANATKSSNLLGYKPSSIDEAMYALLDTEDARSTAEEDTASEKATLSLLSQSDSFRSTANKKDKDTQENQQN